VTVPFSPNGVITITTDFGHRGPFVAVMKGRVLGRFPGARIVDVTHEILVHWPAEAGFWLARMYEYFPRGSVHVGVVDPGVGTDRQIIAVVADGHAFLAPDNGLLAPVMSRAAQAVAYRLDWSRRERLGLGEPSATFHGRDVFAPLAADIASGRTRPSELGELTREIVPDWIDEPSVQAGTVRGVVVTIDHFGNLITNIDQELIAAFHRPAVQTGNHRFSLHRTYGEVRPGEYLALVNSFGVVEIARAEQSAAEGLGLGRGAPVAVVEEAS